MGEEGARAREKWGELGARSWLHVLLIMGSILVAGVFGGFFPGFLSRGAKVLTVKCVISMGRSQHGGMESDRERVIKTSRLAKRLCPFFFLCFSSPLVLVAAA